jgi:hypothetical protein
MPRAVWTLMYQLTEIPESDCEIVVGRVARIGAE